MTQSEYLIGRFGGLTALARALGHRNPTTVQGWKERGVIPSRQHPDVLAAGAILTPPIEMREFFQSRDGRAHDLSPPVTEAVHHDRVQTAPAPSGEAA